MRKKNLMMALMCAFCLTVSALPQTAVLAEEAGTEGTEEQAAAEDGSAEAETDLKEEAASEAETDAEEAASEAGADAEEEASSEAGADAEEEAASEDEADAEAETEMEIGPRPDYQASDYVTLGDYKGLMVELEPLEVTEEEVDEEIDYEIQYSDAMEILTEGAVEEGDIANIDYEGKKDGVAFDGGTAEGYDLTIGSHTFIDGFEEGLIGVNVGETVDLPLTFPENYGSTELAGQDVVFTVTVNEIRRMPPELTGEVVSTVTDGEYTDVESYRESVRAELEESKEEERQSSLRADLLTQVANICEITGYPQEMLDYTVAQMESYYRSMATQWYSMEFEDFLSTYLGMTPSQFREESVLACQEILQQEMYLKAIAEAEGLELSDEEYAEGLERYAWEYGYETPEELLAANDEGEVRISLLLEKVYDFLIENAVVIDPETETEQMSENSSEITPAEMTTEAGTEAGTEAPADTEEQEPESGMSSGVEDAAEE